MSKRINAKYKIERRLGTSLCQGDEIVVGYLDIVLPHVHPVLAGDLRQVKRDSRLSLFGGENPDALDQFIGQQFFAHVLHLAAGESGPADEIFRRRGDEFIVAQFAPEDIRRGGSEGAGDVVGHAGTEAHDDDVIAGGQGHEIF